MTNVASSALQKTNEAGDIFLQEAGSNFSQFLTWAPSMSIVYYDLTDPKNGIIGSRFMWTDHSGFSGIHKGYEHELL